MCFPVMRVSRTHIPRDACFPAHISLGMRVSHHRYIRGLQRGCNLVRLACNPGVIFVILILILLIQIRNLQ